MACDRNQFRLIEAKGKSPARRFGAQHVDEKKAACKRGKAVSRGSVRGGMSRFWCGENMCSQLPGHFHCARGSSNGGRASNSSRLVHRLIPCCPGPRNDKPPHGKKGAPREEVKYTLGRSSDHITCVRKRRGGLKAVCRVKARVENGTYKLSLN